MKNRERNYDYDNDAILGRGGVLLIGAVASVGFGWVVYENHQMDKAPIKVPEHAIDLGSNGDDGRRISVPKNFMDEVREVDCGDGRERFVSRSVALGSFVVTCKYSGAANAPLEQQ